MPTSRRLATLPLLLIALAALCTLDAPARPRHPCQRTVPEANYAQG